MTDRTTQEIVRFVSAFSLPGFEFPRLPGGYLHDYDEEPIEVASHLAWPRVTTFIHLPTASAKATTQQMVIYPVFLEAALQQDQKQS